MMGRGSHPSGTRPRPHSHPRQRTWGGPAPPHVPARGQTTLFFPGGSSHRVLSSSSAPGLGSGSGVVIGGPTTRPTPTPAAPSPFDGGRTHCAGTTRVFRPPRGGAGAGPGRAVGVVVGPDRTQCPMPVTPTLPTGKVPNVPTPTTSRFFPVPPHRMGAVVGGGGAGTGTGTGTGTPFFLTLRNLGTMYPKRKAPTCRMPTGSTRGRPSARSKAET